MIATSILPEAFPLSRAMVVRLSQDRRLFPSAVPIALSSEEFEAQQSSERERLADRWAALLREVEHLRTRASEILDPVEHKHIEPDWFLRILQEHTPFPEKRGQDETLTTKTVYRWRDRGLIRYEDRDRLTYETSLAVLMMRLADSSRMRGFLPPGDHVNEPHMYVWRQDTPQSPLLPCGLPLKDDIPNHAFLYTRWHIPGLLHPDWLPFGDVGSVRWRGTIEEKGMLLWNLTEQELGIWDQDIVPLGQGILHAAKQTRHTLASLILLKRATLVFQQQRVP